jgi:hypothetical protein
LEGARRGLHFGEGLSDGEVHRAEESYGVHLNGNRIFSIHQTDMTWHVTEIPPPIQTPGLRGGAGRDPEQYRG